MTGIYRGITGVVVKPIEGAQKSGVEGFATGIGKGILGVVTQPASGYVLTADFRNRHFASIQDFQAFPLVTLLFAPTQTTAWLAFS